MKFSLLVFVTWSACGADAQTVEMGNFGYYWRDWRVNSTMPSDAFRGGIDANGDDTYVAKAIHKSGRVVPGVASPKAKKMWFETDSTEFEVTEDVQVLCAVNQKRLKWVNANTNDTVGDVVKDNELIVGGHLFSGWNAVVGRRAFGKEIKLGRVAVSINKTGRIWYFGYNDKGSGWGESKGFQVLVYVKNPLAACDVVNIDVD